MKTVQKIISYFIVIVFSKTSIFAFETEIFKLNINKNNVEDEIIAIYKGYTLNDKILDIDLLKKEEFVEKFHQLVEYKIVIDNSVKQSFTLKEIKYIQNNYVNGYNYELQEIKDNGFMITILTDNRLIYNLLFSYQYNNIVLKYILLRNIYHEHYLICGVYLNININDKIIDIDAIDNEKVCYTFKEQIPISQETIIQYNDIAYYLQQANANEEAIFLLEKIIEKYPNRIVAYLNLADSYNGINNKEKAKENYEKYVKLMKQDNKDERIPKRVLEFLEKVGPKK